METPKPNESIRGPFHILRCIGELTVMKWMEVKREIAECIADAEDVWGDE